MPYRKIIFENENLYHIMNRGVNENDIFRNNKDHQRFLESMNFFRFNPSMQFSDFVKLPGNLKADRLIKIGQTNKPLVEFLAFSLMPNHYHLIMKQLRENGIQTFMRIFQNSYARYFNIRHDRRGHLFQSAFKAILIESDEQLVHTSRYIHLNPVSSSLIGIGELDKYPLTSFPHYLNNNIHDFINIKTVLDYFNGSTDVYKKFVYDQTEYQIELERTKHE